MLKINSLYQYTPSREENIEKLYVNPSPDVISGMRYEVRGLLLRNDVFAVLQVVEHSMTSFSDYLVIVAETGLVGWLMFHTSELRMYQEVKQ
jgi:hypothetical protein